MKDVPVPLCSDPAFCFLSSKSWLPAMRRRALAEKLLENTIGLEHGNLHVDKTFPFG